MRVNFFGKSNKVVIFFKCEQVFYNFEETQKSIKEVVGDVHCLGKYCFDTSCNFLENHVSTPKSFYSCAKYGAWSLFHQVPYTTQELLKTRKMEETWFFAKKKRSRDHGRRKRPLCRKRISVNHNQPHWIFGLNSVALNEKDLVQKMTLRSQELSFDALNLLF